MSRAVPERMRRRWEDELQAWMEVRAIFDREITEAESNLEPSPRIDWLERLRDKVLAALGSDASDFETAVRFFLGEGTQIDGDD